MPLRRNRSEKGEFSNNTHQQMKKLIRTTFALFASISLTSSLHAVVLAGWDVSGVDLDAAGASGIDGNSTSSPYIFTAGTLAPGVSDAKLTLSSTVTSSTSANQYGFKIPGASSTTTLSGAVAAEHYLQFTLTASGGSFLNLTSLEMNGEASSTGANDVAVFTSIDGFIAGSQIASVTGVAGATGGFDTDASGFGAPINLTDAKYQGLSSIIFRIYGYNSTSGAGVTNFRNLSGNDLIINGTVVPEPSTGIMLLGGAGILLMLRRRHS